MILWTWHATLNLRSKRETGFLFHNARLQFFFYFGQRTDNIQNCNSFFAFTFSFTHQIQRKGVNYGKHVFIELITDEENCFNVAFIF